MSIERLRMKTSPPELAGEFHFGPEAIDGNLHVNHTFYLVVFEAERARFIEHCGTSIDEIRETYGLSPMVLTGLINYTAQVYEGDRVKIYSKAENAKSHLVFSQRMVKGVQPVADFQCVVAMVNAEGKIRRIPAPLGELIDRGNARLRS